MNTLLEAVRTHAERHSFRNGAPTGIQGLTVLRETAPTELTYAISRPLVVLVVQGAKRVTMGRCTCDFTAGESLLITADVPTVSQITRASTGSPYLSLVVDLDPSVIEPLVSQMVPSPRSAGVPVSVATTDSDVEDAALRLMRLLNRPAAVPVLQGALTRELHYWLLSGRHGMAVRALGVVDGHARRIALAMSMIRTNYAKPLRVTALAEVAGMSLSTFHEHFRAFTSLTPLQFQKQMRLIEARRLLLADGSTIGSAAYAVGYASVPQFTRDYGRMFGMPPARDMKAALTRMQAAESKRTAPKSGTDPFRLQRVRAA